MCPVTGLANAFLDALQIGFQIHDSHHTKSDRPVDSQFAHRVRSNIPLPPAPADINLTPWENNTGW
jgi:hypothetical protein